MERLGGGKGRTETLSGKAVESDHRSRIHKLYETLAATMQKHTTRGLRGRALNTRENGSKGEKGERGNPAPGNPEESG